MYHQARVLMNKGEKDKAKDLLVKVKDELNKPEEPIAAGLPTPPPFPYLKEVAMDRLREIDPSAAPKLPAGAAGGAMNLTPDQIKKMLEKMQQQKGGKH